EDSPYGFPNHTLTIERILNKWWYTGKNYGVEKFNRFYDSKLRYFARMVLHWATRLGCAYTICDEYMAVACLYNPKLMIHGQKLWETGKPCKTGSDCTTFSNSECDGGLCVKTQ
ncbi:hypothetical protein OESDEN_18849, partial [Oesophagostomum dentatum]